MVPRAGIRMQDWPADYVQVPREPGHQSPVHGGVTPGLNWVELTKGTTGIWFPQLLPAALAWGTEWFPEISGSNIHIKLRLSMREDRGGFRRNSSNLSQQSH